MAQWSLKITIPVGTTPEMSRIIIRDAQATGLGERPHPGDARSFQQWSEAKHAMDNFVKHVKSLVMETVLGEHIGSTTHALPHPDPALAALGDSVPGNPVGFHITATGGDGALNLSVQTLQQK
jgi:hypothetical protein